jgi:hypothetical protein
VSHELRDTLGEPGCQLRRECPSVTLKIYADLFDTDLDAAAVNLAAGISVGVQKHPSTIAERAA